MFINNFYTYMINKLFKITILIITIVPFNERITINNKTEPVRIVRKQELSHTKKGIF